MLLSEFQRLPHKLHGSIRGVSGVFQRQCKAFQCVSRRFRAFLEVLGRLYIWDFKDFQVSFMGTSGRF